MNENSVNKAGVTFTYIYKYIHRDGYTDRYTYIWIKIYILHANIYVWLCYFKVLCMLYTNITSFCKQF